ncbi:MULTISPECIES: helix-turn-helix domain-containing protein [unclassified Microcoleus]
MPKAYKFRIYPSAHQQQYFAGDERLLSMVLEL